jgi:ribonuclease P protein component
VTERRRAVGRLGQPADFARVLKTSSRARSPHFVIHHLADKPTVSRFSRPSGPELSTGSALQSTRPVDDSSQDRVLEGLWLGAVVPKRHARRAVTRTMLKRQIRMAMAAASTSLLPGLWVVRLRAPFDRAQFPSATSSALIDVVRTELAATFAIALRPRQSRS